MGPCSCDLHSQVRGNANAGEYSRQRVANEVADQWMARTRVLLDKVTGMDGQHRWEPHHPADAVAPPTEDMLREARITQSRASASISRHPPLPPALSTSLSLCSPPLRVPPPPSLALYHRARPTEAGCLEAWKGLNALEFKACHLSGGGKISIKAERIAEFSTAPPLQQDFARERIKQCTLICEKAWKGDMAHSTIWLSFLLPKLFTTTVNTAPGKHPGEPPWKPAKSGRSLRGNEGGSARGGAG